MKSYDAISNKPNRTKPARPRVKTDESPECFTYIKMMSSQIRYIAWLLRKTKKKKKEKEKWSRC